MYSWIPLSSTADLAQLATHLGQEYAPDLVARKLTAGISSAVKGVLVEQNYIDKDYRSTYYNFYAKKGRRYGLDCARLHFFDETVTFDKKAFRLSCPDSQLADHYFGYMVLRPTGIATIGRSVVSPDVRKGASRFIIHAKHKVHVLGYRLVVEGFPSMDQHVDISVCAHAACWSILRHYSERYNIYREFLTHDITMMAQPFNPGGLIPSRGLEVSHAERVLQEAGTFPVHVARNIVNGSADPAFYHQLGAYVESGFPLFAAMHKQAHAIAVVGYDREHASASASGLRYAWDEMKALAVIDDNHLPYLSIPTTAVSNGSPYSAENIDAFIVALPEKIFYPADAVDRLAPTLFKLNNVIQLPDKDDCVTRYFITTGSALRMFVRKHESEFDSKLLETIMTLPFAQFVWIVEIATKAQWAVDRISARAVVDATASLREPMPLWLFHSTTRALVLDRQRMTPDLSSGIGVLEIADAGHSGFSRMDQNLRTTKTK